MKDQTLVKFKAILKIKRKGKDIIRYKQHKNVIISLFRLCTQDFKCLL
jgi:hypothetical protein